MGKNAGSSRQVIEIFGGASRARTDGLVVANDALSQLSYSPTKEESLVCDFILTAFAGWDQAAACVGGAVCFLCALGDAFARFAVKSF